MTPPIQPKGFVNLTPHPINIFEDKHIDDGPVWVIPPSGKVARLKYLKTSLGVTNEITHYLVEYGQLENVPPVVRGTYYVVSLVTALAVRDRDDFMAPYNEIRNTDGTVIGCRYLQRIV